MRRLRFGAVLVLASSGCVFNALGWDEAVTETSSIYQPPQLTDDVLADKHPAFDASRVVQESFGVACTLTLNKTGSITKLDLPGYVGDDAKLEDALYPSYAAALKALGTREVLPSMELLEASLKPFDDGLYAAVELGAEDGSSASLVDKRAMLEAVLAQLVTNAGGSGGGATSEQAYAREGAAQLAAAVKLAGGSPSAPSDVLAQADLLTTAFEAEPLYARPIGFYTWSDPLGRVFRRDRFLQAYVSAPSFGADAAIAHAVQGAGVRADYQRALDLYAGLTDGYFHRPLADLVDLASAPGAFDDLAALQASYAKAHPEVSFTGDPCGARLAMLPPSESPDQRTFRTMFCAAPPPSGTNLLDVLVNLIRAGQVDLTPRAGSGWLSRQMWALQTLLVPESAPERDHLFLTAAYKKKLISTFETIVVENRETHAKQTEISAGFGGSSSETAPIAPVDLYPLLPVEPFPSYYLRTARAYRFVQTLLKSVMGPAFLVQARRLKEDGTRSTTTLDAELEAVIVRSYGFYALAADSIGSDPALSVGEDDGVDLQAARKAARAWLAGWQTDADVARDPRVIVPEFADADAAVVHYWAMVGVRAVPMQAEFVAGYEPKLLTDYACTTGKFVPHTAYLLIGKTLDVAIPMSKAPPTRDELRALCDQKGSADAIAAALVAP